MGQTLRQAGYQVFEAHTAALALEMARLNAPRLGLLDIHLPDINGYELFALLHREPNTRHMPIIFHSATVPSEAAQFVIGSLGAEGLVRDPVEPEELVRLVQTTIARTL
jgi:CheY-like chemotaxis protein